MLLAADEAGIFLKGAWFIGQKYIPASLAADATETPDLQVFIAARRWLDNYFSGRDPGPTPPLAPINSTPFRRRVWDAMNKIPRGSVLSYSQLAVLAGLSKQSSRAVGGAVAHNPLLIFQPCHRVTPACGADCGQFAAGQELKKALLALEQATQRS